jgi:light-regulated signal transduction histidine kinase (bacteriophytochrome)
MLMTPCSLLVVDAGEADRAAMALALGAAFPRGQIECADDPLRARDLCEAHHFDCVILDYNLPDIDGVALAGALRSAHAYLPIILVSSVRDEMLVAAALRAGASDYMPKSRVTAESMRRAVDRAIKVSAQSRLIDEQRSELENFAYALAHDFKQPIRQITTFTQLITEGMRGMQTGPELTQQLTFLGEAARRLGKLVDVMSQYTLLNQPPELTEVSLNRVLERLKTVLAPYLAERGAQLAIPRKAVTVVGNETLLSQVLQNLVMNGLTYNKNPAPRVEISSHRSGGQWIIEVKDNGIGIEAEYLAEIFKPLVRLHTASEYAGTGLGLTLARKAVVAQKGSIWCESAPGQGSTFHIRLPRAEAPAKLGAAHSAARAA